MAIRRQIAPLDRNLPLFIDARDEITASVYALFQQRFSSVLANAVASRVQKDLTIRGQLTPETIAEVIRAIRILEWHPLLKVARRQLRLVAKESVVKTLWQIGIDENDPVAQTALSQARQWADQRAQELVGARESGDELMEDPTAKNSIAQTSKEMIAASLASIASKEISVPEALAAIPAMYALSAARAELIGKTEVDTARSRGQLFAYNNSGVVQGLRWVTMNDNRVEPHCRENERAGIVKVGERFPSGHEYPPAHPRCRCNLAAVSVTE